MITEKDIPAGFELLWENGITIIVRPDDAEAVREFLSRPFPAQSAEEYRGRGRLYRIHRGEDKPALLVKQYLRGGVFRGILKDRFLSALRFVSELYLTGVAAKQSVPTLKIAALAIQPAGAMFKRAYLFTEELRDTMDLAEYCKAHANAPPAERRVLASAVAREIRNMHDGGIYHADLHLKNILVKKDDPGKVYIIDFDNGDYLADMPEERRVENLMRLDRSAEKLNLKSPLITLTDRIRCLKAYCGGKKEVYGRFKELVRGQVKWRKLHRAWWKVLGRG
jgi:tRNA A-37 threonylcarbamoyl transferase component Bud32